MTRLMRRCGLFAAVLTLASGVAARGADSAPTPSSAGPLVYIGTYTSAKSKGIYVCRMDPETGTLSPLQVAAETPSPSFLAFHPNKKFLYAVGETEQFGGKKSGSVAAFSIDPGTGKLTAINAQSSGGTGPCHLTVDPTGHDVLVANYNSGSVAVLPIAEDGKLAEPSFVDQHKGTGHDRRRQEGPHAHNIQLDPNGKFVLTTDLGLDKIFVYRLDTAKGTLTPNDPPFGQAEPGAGPRHFAFHPNGRLVYVINELASTVAAYAYDAQRGALTQIQSLSTLPADFKGNNTTAEVQVHPNGKFLYGSNRGHDSIAVFAIDESTGKLTPRGHVSTQGKTPRNFGIDPTGSFLIAANQATDNLVVFRIDPQTGELKPTGSTASVGSPVCVKFFTPGK